MADAAMSLAIDKAFLKDADSKADKEGISEGVKAWVKQGREVAYCVEDVIDKYMVEACAAQHRDQQRGLMGSVLYSICSLVSKLKPRHEIVSGIQDIMARLQEINDRSERFRFISSEHVTSSSNWTTVLLHDHREESLFIEEVGFWGDVENALFNNDNGSRILATTRNEDVANFCKRSSLVHVYQMEPLPQQEAWELFCKKAFKFDFQGNCPKDLEALSHNIVRRCGGLPLAIVAVGGLLATKEKVVLEWKRLLDNLGSALVCDPHVENVTKILFLSYNDLPYHLKSCFLHFARHDVRKDSRRILELIHRSLVQLNEAGLKGILRTCRVHDLVRDIILSKSVELSFCHISKNCSSIEGIARRRLSISKRVISNISRSSSSTKSQTRSVMVFNGVDVQKPLISAIFTKFKLLTMLDFERYVSHRSHPQRTGKLVASKMRKLGITDLKREHGRDLCTALEEMVYLQTQSVFSVNKDEILEAQTMSPPPPHLQSLYLHGKSERFPCWISKLNNLVTLGLVFSRLTDDPVKVFQALPSLKSLGFFCGYDEEEVHFEGGFLKLKWLSLSGLNPIIIEKGALPLLQELAIGACPQQRQVPSGIQHLKDLKELSFAGMPDDSTQRLSCNGGEDYWMVKNVPCLQYDGIYDPNDETSYAAEVKRYLE
uniref:NB-ARC domain-containing protein n=2 Tax=Populus alba TaxID=43335 RepID=A0A4V6A912_POPAL|nr:hypothetical protein D5086_0000137400 [Populus alba]